MAEFYNGTKLLSLKDINGDDPEIYICTSNRSAGKTTFFNRLLVRRFLKNGEKFCVLVRFNYELIDIESKFFKDVQQLFFPGHEMTCKRRANGKYAELFINGDSCGYCVAINDADTIKKYSHMLADTCHIIFDEFQSETSHYSAREVEKFISIHTSIARGHGEQSRRVPVYMVSNPVTILNPYYTKLGISNRLKTDTNFLRGEGWVLEQGYVESAKNALSKSAFNRAFSSDSYMSYSMEGVYLNDNTAFIDKPTGQSRYLATLRCDGQEYCLREFTDAGIVYCDDKPDMTFPFKITVTSSDHSVNYLMLQKNDFFISTMRTLFSRGLMRFKNTQCKNVIIKMLTL